MHLFYGSIHITQLKKRTNIRKSVFLGKKLPKMNNEVNVVEKEKVVIGTEKKQSKTKKIIKLVFKILGYIFLIYFGAYILIDAFFPKSTLGIFGYKSYVVRSYSMTPMYNRGDIVFLTYKDQDKIVEGDVITFQAIGRALTTDDKQVKLDSEFTHHVAEIDKSGEVYLFRTMPHEAGNWDKHLAHLEDETLPDGTYDKWYVTIAEDDDELTDWVSFDAVVGVVSGSLPYVGKVSLFLTEKAGFNDPIMFGLVVINIVIVYLIIKLIVGEIKERKEIAIEGEGSEALDTVVEVVEPPKEEEIKPLVEANDTKSEDNEEQ